MANMVMIGEILNESRREEVSTDVLGNIGETTKNGNDKRIIDFCIMNNLIHKAESDETGEK